MGNITNLTNKYNEIDSTRSKANSKKKPYFYIEKKSFAKDLANLTFNPNLHKKYRLNDRYKKLQLGTRVTLAAVIAALGIGAGVAYSNVSSEKANSNVKTDYTTEILQKDDVLEDAEYMLKQCVFGDNLEDIKDPQIIYKYDRSDGSYYIKVTSENNSKIHYSYSNNLSVDRFTNDKEIVKLIEDTMELYFTSSPSQNQLQKLDNQLDALKDKKFTLQGKNIVSISEKETDLEIE